MAWAKLPPPPFKPTAKLPYWPLDKTLFVFQDAGGACIDFSIRNAADGIAIFGNKGSGKSSGSGNTIQTALVAAKCGMVILPFKEGSERQQIERIAREEGRSHQLCIVEPGGKFRINLLEYLMHHPLEAVRSAKNFAPLLEAIFQAVIRGEKGLTDFWVGQVARIAENAFVIVANCGERPTMSLLLAFVRSAPKTAVEARQGAWRKTVFGELLTGAIVHAAGTPAEGLVNESVNYWQKVFPVEPPEARGGALMGFENLASVFSDPLIRQLFEAEETTLVPEHVVQDTAILFVDLPIAKYQTVGRVAQILWRTLVQEAILRRTDREGDSRPPAAVWCDEFQFHIDKSLNHFLSTCREVRGVFVGLTQSLPALYASVGGNAAVHNVDAMLSNLVTKIFHNLTDPATTKWASEQIGYTRRWVAGGGTSEQTSPFASLHHGPSESLNLGQQVEPLVRPEEFQRLATGGPRNDFCVESICLLGQKALDATGRPFLEVTFEQAHARPNVESQKTPAVRRVGWLRRLFGFRV